MNTARISILLSRAVAPIAALLLSVSTQITVAQSIDKLDEILAAQTFSGIVHANERALVSNSVNGLITEIHFSPGDYVEEGQLLFELGDSDYVLQVAATEAEVQRREIALASARANAERATQLRTRGTGTALEEQDTASVLAVAELDLAEAKIRFDQLKLRLSATKLRAPISGYIDVPRQIVGSYLTTDSGLSLAEIVQLDPALISYQVPYDLLLLLEQASDGGLMDFRDQFEVQVTLPSGATLEEAGRMSYVGTDLNSANELTVWAKVPNPNSVLIPGLDVTVSVSLGD